MGQVETSHPFLKVSMRDCSQGRPIFGYTQPTHVNRHRKGFWTIHVYGPDAHISANSQLLKALKA